MTTVQESSNGHKAFPPPLAVENPAELNRPDLPTDKADNNQPANVDPIIERQRGFSSRESPAANVYPQDELRGVTKDHQELSRVKEVASAFAANAYHVPPTRYAPKANSYRYDDFPSAEIDTTPLPERCQFMFSDGRQCTMARSDIHPSLCRFHAEREDQLFGSPVSGSKVPGAAFDLPELHSACRDLTTAAGVNRALAQVFRLFAQRRISRQEAATFGHLAQLLLRSISLARSSPEGDDATSIVIPSAGESHHLQRKGYQQDALFAGNKAELSPDNKVHRERGISRELSRVNSSREGHADQELSRVTRGDVILSESDSADESKDFSASAPVNGTPVQCSPGPSPTSIRTPSEDDAPDLSCNQHLNGIDSNSRTISTYRNVEHKPIQNQHLHKNGTGHIKSRQGRNNLTQSGSL